MPEDVSVSPEPQSKGRAKPFQKRKQLEQDIAHITEEMYRRNRELADTNRTLSLVRTIDALVLESHASVRTVCEHITEAITQVTEYPFVGLMTRSGRDRDELTLNGWSGNAWLNKDKNDVFDRPMHIKMDHPWFGALESSKLIPLDGLKNEAIAEILKCRPQEIKRFRDRTPLKAVYIVKLTARRRLVGLLAVGLDSISADDESGTKLIDSISESVGVALDNKLLFEENQAVLRQLQTTNAKLQALDEAKDDFISMASHQLRTPLTSIKGYISMVLEGDAGKVNPKQKEMLDQASVSAQRMVYLIADLLNVSRLKTGKFVIERSNVNLATIVEEEVSQLVRTAAAHQLELKYEKPKNFPNLMLDETKTRQIIMNFIDNAIYYTPAGGSITVELIEKASTVELHVTDTGMGVPRSEQPHLFTKFYRAGNARKARPDGTGLGLFMAKKVVVSQGGSIVFKSKEGQGSTFGFIFSKTKNAVPEQ